MREVIKGEFESSKKNLRREVTKISLSKFIKGLKKKKK